MNCPWCQSPSQKFAETTERQYRFCPTCKLVFVPPEFFISEEDEIRRYLEHENSLDNAGYVAMFQKKIDDIRQSCEGIRSVLDFGCGYAPVLKTLLEREGFETAGYDPYFFPDWNPDARYDLILSTETFEHLKEPGREWDKLADVLKPGGYLAVMTQFYPVAHERLEPEEFLNWYYHRDPTHICFYTPETFQWIARHKGFQLTLNNEKDFIILKKS